MDDQTSFYTSNGYNAPSIGFREKPELDRKLLSPAGFDIPPQKFNLRAGDYLRSNRPLQAIRILEAGRTVHPHDLIMISMLGSLYNKDGRNRDAVAVLKMGLAINRRDKVVNCELGNAYFALGDYVNAERYFSRAINRDPSDVRSNVALVNLFLDRQQWGKAEMQLENIIEHTPGVSAVKRRAEARWFTCRDQFDISEKILHGVLIDDPHNIETIAELGKTKAVQREWEVAQILLQSALDTFPSSKHLQQAVSVALDGPVHPKHCVKNAKRLLLHEHLATHHA